MSSSINTAREQGYSDEEIFTFLSQKDPRFKSAKDSGYSLDEVSNFIEKKEPDKPFSLKETGKAYASGAAGGAGGLVPDVLGFLEAGKPLPLTGGLSQIPKLAKRLKVKETEELTESFQEKIGGRPPASAAERIAQVGGEFGGQEALLGTALGGPVGGGLGAVHGTATGFLYGGLKELGVEDPWALLISGGATLSPIAARKLWQSYKKGKEIKKALGEVKKSFPEYKKSPEVLETFREIERYPSGLTKLKISDGETTIGQLSSNRQKQVVRRLNDEASKLTQEVIKKRLPIASKVEEGFDFEKAFRKGFSELESQAQKFKPYLDNRPLFTFFNEASRKFRGISPDLLSADERKILRYIKGFNKRPIDRLDRGLTVFRSNNSEISRILGETKGFETPYVRFLRDTNRALANSIEETFPKGSEWVKRFKATNETYKNFKRYEEIRRKLRPIIKGEATYANVVKIAEDPKIYKRLRLSMGEEGANEIRQIAEDLQSAFKSLQKVPKHTVKELDAIYPLKLIGLPFYGAKKLIGLGRRGIGVYLTTPKIRTTYIKALKAAEKGNIPEYKKATNELKKEMKLIEHKTTS